MKPTKIKLLIAIMATCLFTFATAHPGNAEFKELDEAEYQLWEYKIIHRLGHSKQTPEGHLNEFGRNGWELVLIKQTSVEHLPTYIFKRPVNKAHPVTASSQKPDAKEVRKVFEVSMTSEGLSVQGNPISLKELEKQFTSLSDDTKILIQAEPTISHNEVVSVFELCRNAGLKNVALSTTKAEQAASDQRFKGHPH